VKTERKPIKVSAKYRADRFYDLGAVVTDTMSLLEHCARLHDRDIAEKSAYARRHLEGLRQFAMLTARHALAPVLAALNDEHRGYLAEQWREEVAQREERQRRADEQFHRADDSE
jgi:hypothetical protein